MLTKAERSVYAAAYALAVKASDYEDGEEAIRAARQTVQTMRELKKSGDNLNSSQKMFIEFLSDE